MPKVTVCGDNNLYVPETGCTECEELEIRVRHLEECCAEAQEALTLIGNRIDAIDTRLNGKQDALTAGDNISINENNVISATDTTYSKEDILSILGYEEVELSMTDTDGNTVRKTILTAKPTVAYAYIDTGTKEMHFFRDESGKYTNGQVEGTKTYYADFEDKTYAGWWEPREWQDNVSVPIKVVFDGRISPIDAGSFFSGMTLLASIENIELLDTSRATNMSSMFNNCGLLSSIDLSNFDTRNVTNMANMFNGCSSVTSINASSFDTSNVTNMNNMFYGCSNATTIDVSNFDTSNVSNMQRMFQDCRRLQSIDVSSFDTSAVEDTSSMFEGCTLLTTIYASASFVTSGITTSYRMFTGDSALVGGSGTTYNASYVDKTRAKIDGGTSDPGYFTAV